MWERENPDFKGLMSDRKRGVQTVGEDTSLKMSDCGAQTLGHMMEETVQWKKEWLFKQRESLEHH